ncbi:hypothetical protein QBC44DRAFT_368954 [Cladorrhinum sp. PSN332]|nr:hypothetical protein QBC44DRAFT_368954 [Cladorrhinum sp. PSN332]
MFNINGVKTAVADVQLPLEQTVQGKGVVSRLVVFPSCAAHTEQVTAAWVPAGTDRQGIEHVDKSLTQACTPVWELGFTLDNAAYDLTMMAANTGAERTAEQWEEIFDELGLRLVKTYVYNNASCESVVDVRLA